MRTTVAVAVACLSLVTITSAEDAQAAIKQTVSIPPQGLARALNILAKKRGVQLVYRSDLVEGQQTAGAVGELTFDEAITKLLSGTGLTYRYLEDDAITIIPAQDAPAASSAPAPRQVETSGNTQAFLEEVVVTAEKRAESIQAVPTSVSAVAGEKLIELGASRLSDYAQYIPGLDIQDGGSPGQASVSLRGIAALGSGALVSYYIDDTPLGSSSNYAVASLFALDLMPYDLDRLEVLRGPQGTLYGGGAMGGLIKYVLKPADTNSYSTKVGAEVSTIDGGGDLGYSVRAATNIPLIQDTLAIRASAYDRHYQGYTDDVFTGDKNSNTGKEYGGRVALTWIPRSDLRVNLSGLWNRTESDDNAVVTLGDITTYDEGGTQFYRGRPIFGDMAGSHPLLQPFSKEIDYYAGAITYDAPYGITVTSASSWSETATKRVQDSSISYGEYPLLFDLPLGYSDFLLDLNLRKFTQELRAASADGGTLEWLIGAFYTKETNSNYQVANIYGPDYQQLPGPVFSPFFLAAQLPSTYKEYAAFGDLTWNITDKFDITGGVRYASNKQDFRQITDGLALGGLTDQKGHSSEDVTTWSASTRYRFTQDVMVYAKVATGYRPGGPNLAIAGARPTVSSDTLTSYESGLKSTFFDGRFLLNLAGFYIDWDGIQLQVSNPACSCSYLANAGNAISRGVELEGQFAPTEGLRFGYNAAYTKNRLTSLLPGAPPFLLDFQLPGVPERSLGATADYSWWIRDDLRASVGAGVRYVGEQNITAVSVIGATPNSKQPSYTTGDVRAGLTFNRYALNFFVRNVANKTAYLAQTPAQSAVTGVVSAIDATPLQPRVIGLSVDVEF